MIIGITTYRLHEFPDLLELTKKCIHSITSQNTTFPILIIILDQRTNQTTLDHLTNILGANGFLIHQEDNNVSRALNTICTIAFKDCDQCLLLSNDTELQEGTLQSLPEFAKQHPRAIITAPAVNDLAAFLISKSIYEEVGPFDENLKGGSLEDWDYLERMKEKNITFLPCPDFHVAHVGRATINHVLSDPEIQELRQKSLEYYRKKWNGKTTNLP